MTPEQMRIALAKEAGWRLQQEDDGEFSLFSPDGKKVSADWDPTTTFESFAHWLPNYPEDANAALEIVAMLRERGWSDSHFNETWVFYDSARCETHSSTAQTFALAICEAACKALSL